MGTDKNTTNPPRQPMASITTIVTAKIEPIRCNNNSDTLCDAVSP